MPDGFKVFIAGNVLTAAEMNGFLQEQVITVFLDATARDAAITAPEEGQFSFLTGTNQLTEFDGISWIKVKSFDANSLSMITGSSAGLNAVALGLNAIASGDNSAALGRDTDATNVNAIAIGFLSDSTGIGSTAIGSGAQATAESATALGRTAQATATNTTAIGRNAVSSVADEGVIGVNSASTGTKIWRVPGTLDVVEDLTFNGSKVKSQNNIPTARANREAVQSIPTSTDTAVKFDTIIWEKNGDFFDLVADDTLITIDEAGIYHIQAHVTFDNNVTGFRSIRLQRQSPTVVNISLTNQNAVDGAATRVNTGAYFEFAVGDTFNLQAFQNSGGALDILSGTFSNWLSITKISD